MADCPNCRLPVPEDRTVCPNCGANLPDVWPPPPSGQPDVPAPLVERLLTGKWKGDFVLGFLLAVVSTILGVLGVGFIIMPILYVILYRMYPVLARGIGWGWLLALLGAFALCFGPSIVQHILGH